MSPTNVTLKQLATELNLSISTVSKALNNSYEISEKTIKRVRELAKKYNYRPNKVALNLKNRQTKTIGVVIPNILNYFFAKVLLGIEEEANSKGYQIIICLSNNKHKKEVDCLNLLLNGSVDGFILSIAKESQKLKKYNHFNKVIDSGYPILMFDRVSNQIENCDKVINDDRAAAYKATRYLLETKCKKIALVSTLNDIAIGKLRVEGYKKALQLFSSYANEPIIVEIDNKQDYEKKINFLLNNTKDVDGILTTDNVSAATILRVATKLGYEIPKDISIIGFSDDKISRITTPRLTTVTQHALEIGKQAVNLLVKRIESDEKLDFETKIVETDLNVRESTRVR